MAKKVEVVLNRAGVRALLHECGSTVCKKHADEIAGRCGDGYQSDTMAGANRTVASVYTGTAKAMAHELKHNDILRNLK